MKSVMKSNRSPVKIKEATMSDIEFVAKIVFAAEKGNREKILSALRSEFDELGGNRIIFLAHNDETVIGTVQLLLKRADNNPELADGSYVGHMHRLVVPPAMQKQGIGKLLVEKLETYAKERGFKKITLGVDNWNENAIGFYDYLGYKKFKEAKGRTSEEKVYYMAKDLK